MDFHIGVGCIKGRKEDFHNQDDFNISVGPDMKMISVLDGHGTVGHAISNFAQRELHRRAYEFLTRGLPVDEALEHAFIGTHQGCIEEEQRAKCMEIFDATHSGTTATVVSIQSDLVTVAHVGDSRCILVNPSGRNGSRARFLELTSDHKPSRKDERKRIEQKGGVIRHLKGDVHPRVFVDGENHPGLAMTRSIGDTSGERAGITPKPEIRRLKLDTAKMNVLVVASDGVWEFMTSQEVADLVARHDKTDARGAANSVVKEAVRRWDIESPWAIDDITCIVAFV
jgi:serine/threonine protein phosphatase PrpC